MNRRRLNREINVALRAAGLTRLDEQARALGLSRSTAWTIVAGQHKLDRLQKRTVARILASPQLPPAVRAVVLRYARDRTINHEQPKGFSVP